MSYASEAMTTKTPLRPVLTLAFCLTLLLLGCRDGQSAGAAPAGVKAGAAAGFRLKTLEGRPLGPKDFPGKVVVIDFWATWCGPCRIQAQVLEPIYREYGKKGVQFLAANVGEEAPTVRAFLKDRPIPYTVLLDPEDVADQLGIYALPTVMVIDKTGHVSYFEPGLSDGVTIRRALAQAGA